MESLQLKTAISAQWENTALPPDSMPQELSPSLRDGKFDDTQFSNMMDLSQILNNQEEMFPGSLTDMLNGSIDIQDFGLSTEHSNTINTANTPRCNNDMQRLSNDSIMMTPVMQSPPLDLPASSVRRKSNEIDQSPDDDDVPKRKRRRPSTAKLNGLTEEEALTRLLPDHLCPGLDMVIIGINPGLISACIGHHYAGPANHFWKCMYMSGLIPEALTAYDDFKLLQFGIGFTNIVPRTTRTSTDLSRKEIKDGARMLQDKMEKFKPKIAVFNGIGIYELFIGRKDFHVGKQPHPFPGVNETSVFVMPSSSARFTQLPRAVDKLPFYLALKKLRDYLNGRIPPPPESELSFPEVNFRIIPKKERPGYDAEQAALAEQNKLNAARKKRVRRYRKSQEEGDDEEGAEYSGDAALHPPPPQYLSPSNKESQGYSDMSSSGPPSVEPAVLGTLHTNGLGSPPMGMAATGSHLQQQPSTMFIQQGKQEPSFNTPNTSVHLNAPNSQEPLSNGKSAPISNANGQESKQVNDMDMASPIKDANCTSPNNQFTPKQDSQVAHSQSSGFWNLGNNVAQLPYAPQVQNNQSFAPSNQMHQRIPMDGLHKGSPHGNVQDGPLGMNYPSNMPYGGMGYNSVMNSSMGYGSSPPNMNPNRGFPFSAMYPGSNHMQYGQQGTVPHTPHHSYGSVPLQQHLTGYNTYLRPSNHMMGPSPPHSVGFMSAQASPPSYMNSQSPTGSQLSSVHHQGHGFDPTAWQQSHSGQPQPPAYNFMPEMAQAGTPARHPYWDSL